jgi:hypothetical protein
LLKAFMLLHLIRFSKLKKIWSVLISKVYKSDVIFGVLASFKLLLIVFYVAHVIACLW